MLILSFLLPVIKAGEVGDRIFTDCYRVHKGLTISVSYRHGRPPSLKLDIGTHRIKTADTGILNAHNTLR